MCTDLQSAEGLIQSNRSDGADDDCFSVPTQGVLQDAGQLTVSVVGETPEEREKVGLGKNTLMFNT